MRMIIKQFVVNVKQINLEFEERGSELYKKR